jgi:hypothetical protein
MNQAQKALLDRLRQLIDETPKSGALNAAKQPLYVTRFAQAVERRAADGAALVEYVRAKVHEAATSSYSALVEVGRSDLTVEALVADADAPWASEFTNEDRAAARARLGTMIDAHRESQEALEAAAVAHDRAIVAEVSARRVAKGKPALTPEQEAAMLRERAARRATST